MDYEKKYKNALAHAREIHRNEEGKRKDMEFLFSELKESEDERIRKGIIRNLEYLANRAEGFVKDDLKEKIAWLEKQGEQKPVSKLKPKFRIGDVIEVKPMKCQDKIFTGKNNKIIDITEESYILDDGKAYSIELQNGWKLSEQKSDEVESKFKPGDWISGYYTNYKVLSLNNDGYVVEDVDGDKINILFENEKFHHLFTIADAKDGDVLATKKGNLFIYDKNRYDNGLAYYYVGLVNKELTIKGPHNMLGHFGELHSVSPATKDQRDTLERAMTGAGYTFDFEKKELKKISQRNISAEAKEAMYGKPTAWSEEDEQITLSIEQVMNCASLLNIVPEKMDKIRTWLKSLKQRIGGKSYER